MEKVTGSSPVGITIAFKDKHLAFAIDRDLMSPHGLPIPYASQVGSVLGLSKMQMIDWLCFNVGDLLTGGYSVYLSLRVTQALRSYSFPHEPPMDLGIRIILNGTIKVATSVVVPNPIGVLSGVYDISIAAYFIAPSVLKALRGKTKLSYGGALSNHLQLQFSVSEAVLTYCERLRSTTQRSPRMIRNSVGALTGGFASFALGSLNSGTGWISAAAIGGYIAGSELADELFCARSDEEPESEMYLVQDYSY